MYTDVTLNAKDFSKIHNALWELQYNSGDLTEQVEAIREALKECYAQDREAANRLYAHYESVRKDLGLTARWSITDVKDLSESHPYKNARTVTYKDHWGDNLDVVVPVNGFTWSALYVAADAAIRDSGDDHHAFIEAFKQDGDTLVLVTGS